MPNPAGFAIFSEGDTPVKQSTHLLTGQGLR
jgi:hypothetical protein